MKSLLITALVSSLIAHGSGQENKGAPDVLPDKCPSVSFLSYEGLDHVTPFPVAGSWIGIKENSSYDTNNTWTFELLDQGNKNGKLAIKELSAKLISFQSDGNKPVWDNSFGAAVCGYKLKDSDVIAIAFSPAVY